MKLKLFIVYNKTIKNMAALIKYRMILTTVKTHYVESINIVENLFYIFKSHYI